MFLNNINRGKFTHEHLQKYVDDGLLLKSEHPDFPLTIYTYSHKCQIDNYWDEVTKRCRGLVLDHNNDEIVAIPFPKFFNIEENRHKPTDDFEVYDKVDGSLIILFYYKHRWVVASKGSFTSDHAWKAWELIDKYYDLNGLTDLNYTYLLEVIWPGNRIVVNYGDYEGLVLLNAINSDNLEELSYNILKNLSRSTGFDLVKRYNFKDYQNIQELNWENHEGFVICFSNGDRCKIKFEDYKRLHKVLTNLNEQDIWEQLKFNDGELGEDFLALIPDELYPKVKEIASNLCAEINQYEVATISVFKGLEHINDRKEFALKVKEADKLYTNYHEQWKETYIVKSALFAMYDGKWERAQKIMWDKVKPAKNPVLTI
jgi:RNA ligase